jgi:hypothetical protein
LELSLNKNSIYKVPNHSDPLGLGRKLTVTTSDGVGLQSYSEITKEITFYPYLASHIGNFTLYITLQLDCNDIIKSEYSIPVYVVNHPISYVDSTFKYPDISIGVSTKNTVTIPEFKDPEGYQKSTI